MEKESRNFHKGLMKKKLKVYEKTTVTVVRKEKMVFVNEHKRCKTRKTEIKDWCDSKENRNTQNIFRSKTMEIIT